MCQCSRLLLPPPFVLSRFLRQLFGDTVRLRLQECGVVGDGVNQALANLNKNGDDSRGILLTGSILFGRKMGKGRKSGTLPPITGDTANLLIVLMQLFSSEPKLALTVLGSVFCLTERRLMAPSLSTTPLNYSRACWNC